LNEVITPLHELTRALNTKNDSGDLPQKSDLTEWLTRAKEASKAVNKRVFVMMTAQTRGWPFAKKLTFTSQVCRLNDLGFYSG